MLTNFSVAIFAVDDDNDTRISLDALFSRSNIAYYTIFSEAKELLDKLHNNVQVCIIDYDLKDLDYNGITLMKEIKIRNPWCKCIIISGYEEGAIVKDFLNHGAYRYITKGDKEFSTDLINYVNEAIFEIKNTLLFFNTLLEELKTTKFNLEKIDK